MAKPDEDVAHILVRASSGEVERVLDAYMAGRGYGRLALRGRRHLSQVVNWASPFEPPPEYRCLALVPVGSAWISVLDELDRIDWRLAETLARTNPTWILRGWQAPDEFEWIRMSELNEWQPGVGPALPENLHQALHRGYDEVLLADAGATAVVFGYSRGRPYPTGPA